MIYDEGGMTPRDKALTISSALLRARAKRIIDGCCFIRLVTFIVITRFFTTATG